MTKAPTHLYDGRELRPFTARQGAMQAFSLPSLQADQRVDHKPPISMGQRGYVNHAGVKK